MNEPASESRRIGSVETDIEVLKTTAQTTTELLAGIAINQKETVQALEALRLSQWPPFLYVLTVAAVGATLMTTALAGMRYLNGAQISEATLLLNYRMSQLERAIALTPSFAVPIPPITPGTPASDK